MSTNDNGATLEAKLNLEGIEDVEILKAKAQEERDARIGEAEARRQLTARAKAAEDKVKELTPDPAITNKEDDSKNKPYNILDDDVASLFMSGYTKDEVKFIMANGGTKALDDKDSFVATAINTKREQRKVETEASKTSTGTGQSEIFTKYTPEQLKNMKAADLEKLLPKTY